MKLIFFKGNGDWQDKLIRFFTRSQFSHCEFYDEDKNLFIGVRPETGKVSEYYRLLQYDEWEIISLPKRYNNEIYSFYNKTKSQGYDWVQIVFTHILPFNLHKRNKWTCSEWCAKAIGINNSYRYSPEKLYKYIKGKE